jgi:hypothetical protein
VFYVQELLGIIIKNATEKNGRVNIAQLYDKLESYLRALDPIGKRTDKYAVMLLPMVESCLPQEILRIWLRNHTVPATAEPQINAHSERFKGFLSFLRTEVEGEERISLAKAGFELTEGSVRRVKGKAGAEETMATASDLFSEGNNLGKPLGCIFCEKPHESRECFLAPRLLLSDKQEVLKKRKCCFTCLKTGHRSRECKTNVRCLVCSKNHWTVMCPEISVSQVKDGADKEHRKDNGKQNAALSIHCCAEEVLFHTLQVFLVANLKKKSTVWALIDTGSQPS